MEQIHHWLLPVINLWASGVGCVAFVLSLIFQDRRDRGWIEVVAMAFFVFMQAAMWGAELFYLATVLLRLAGHGLVIP